MSIRAAIESRLAAWVALQSPAIPVAWQNLAFTPPTVTATNSTYIRPFLMPAGRSGMSLCDVEEAGVYQVSIYSKANVGPGAAEALAQSLCAYFAPSQYTGFRVQIPPYFAQGTNTDDGRYFTPVSIFYRATP